MPKASDSFLVFSAQDRKSGHLISILDTLFPYTISITKFSMAGYKCRTGDGLRK